jgi:hypothetical protein
VGHPHQLAVPAARFALLSKHFEESKVPAVLPKYLPGEWKGAFVLLVMVFVLSSFLDNIAAALIGGAMAHTVFRGKVHIGYLAGIVAASNAGGSGSVVGDTTTTMMWIGGVSPLSVLHAYVAAAVALVICGIPSALQQHKHSPLMQYVPGGAQVDWARVAIVGFILFTAIAANVYVNVLHADISDRFPFIGAAVVLAVLVSAPLRKPEWSLLPEATKGTIFLLSLVTAASMMPVEKLPVASWQTAMGLGFVSAVFDNIPLTALALKQSGYDWHARLHRRLRRFDDLVRVVGRRRAFQHVSGSEECGPLAVSRLARDGSLRDRLLRAARGPGLAARAQARRPAARPAGGRAESRCAGPGCHLVDDGTPTGRRAALT